MAEQKASRKTRAEILSILKQPEITFATVSGILTTKPGMIEAVDRRIPEISVITTKSYQIQPNEGNREPVIAEAAPGCFINAVGLRNPGMEKGYADLIRLRRRRNLKAVLNVSVSGNSPEEFIALVKQFEDVADIIELNLSCPHAAGGYGMSIGTDPEIVYSYIRQIRSVSPVLLFPKLTPNTDRIGEIARAAVEGGADGITAVNTVGPEFILEPHSGRSVLMNSRGNRGGKSGRWIRETALEKITRIRKTVGPELPVIGMGGVETGRDVRAMRKAGADIIGIGSVLASVDPPDWEQFFSALRKDARKEAHTGNDTGRTVFRRMEYIPFRIIRTSEHPGNLKVLELDGTLDYEAGQFAFLWIPGTGEKPFSIACKNPLTFVIRRRGAVTDALCGLQPGETVYVRGAYGAQAPESAKRYIWIAAGGTGIAAAPRLAELAAGPAGKRCVRVFYGMSLPGQEVLKQEILPFAEYHAVEDVGVPGRVLTEMMRAAGPVIRDSALYAIGPAAFMKKAADLFEQAGAASEHIFLSIETMTRCGVGLCGECECGGKLTCREGTFFSWKFIRENGIDIHEN